MSSWPIAVYSIPKAVYSTCIPKHAAKPVRVIRLTRLGIDHALKNQWFMIHGEVYRTNTNKQDFDSCYEVSEIE